MGWPLNKVDIFSAPFLTTDLPELYGNVLERYFLSSSGAGVFVDDTSSLFVSHLSNREICFEVRGNSSVRVGTTYASCSPQNAVLRYSVCVGDHPKTVQETMTHPENMFIQRPAELPDLRMMEHPIWSTWVRYKRDINQSIIEDFAHEILSNNFENAQLEIDDGYETAYGDFEFDPMKFPDPKSMVQNLHEMGFRVTTWVTPFMNPDSLHYLEGRKNSYFIENKSGNPALIQWWNGRGSTVDFTSDEARTWYRDILMKLKSDYNLDSFKFDAGETVYLPKEGLEYSKGGTEGCISNPGVYTRKYADTAFSIGGTMMEMRSAWKAQSLPFYMRIMDKGSRWDTLRGLNTVIPTVLTFSLLGYVYVLPDMIGGNFYTANPAVDKPDRELYIRWLELTAFLPSMQFSISPWQYDEEVTALALKYTKLHSEVIYPAYVNSAKSYISGEMILPVGPIWMVAEADDMYAWEIDDEFLIGERFLVAPIIKEKSTMRDIYLPGSPSTKWIDRMKCSDDDVDTASGDCFVQGGTWIRSYSIPLEDISWWERV